MPQQFNKDYQMYNSLYIRPQSSPFSKPLLNPYENQTIPLQRHVAGTRYFNKECSQESVSFTKIL